MFPCMAVDELDDYSGIARYEQIARIVAREIREGAYPPGTRAPSRVELSQRFGVATETGRRAQRWLADHGYVVTAPGLGVVVTPPDRWPAEPEGA